MTLVSSSVPNLINGVSQQPASLRTSTQCEAQENAYGSPVEGLIKRHPVDYVKKLINGAAGAGTSHIINRDSTEQYTVVVRDGDIDVFDMAGTAMTVHKPDGSDYLDATTPASSFKLLTTADVTYIVNKEKTVAMDTETTPVQLPQAMIWVKQAAYNTDYTVKLMGSSTTETTIGSGDLKTTAIASDLYDNLTSGLSGTYVTVDKGELIDAHTGDGGPTNPDATLHGGRKIMIDSAVAEAGTFVIGARIKYTTYVSGNTTWRQNRNPQIAIWNQANSDRWYTASDLSGYNQYFLSPTTSYYVVEVNADWIAISESPGGVPIVFGAVANSGTGNHKFEEDAPGATAFDNFNFEVSGSIIHVTPVWDPDLSGEDQQFDMTTEDSVGNRYLFGFKDEVQHFVDLPETAKDAFKIMVTGDVESAIDDYHVRFESEDGSNIGMGTWSETIAPGIAYKYDYTTMPHILIRQSDGTFMFKEANGEKTPTDAPGSADYSTFKWNERQVGDLETNPDPSFVGKKINDVFFYSNRLGLLAEENVILSETGEFFNFFRTTVVSLLDTTPIDVASSSNTVAKLHHALVLKRNLVLFSDNLQFILNSGQESGLTPQNVLMAQTGAYESLKDCSPTAMSSSVFFPFNRGSYSGLREMLLEDADVDNYEAFDISSHIPQYISGKFIDLASMPQENIVVGVTDTDTSSLYVYQFYNVGQKRVQSAWSKYTFGSDSAIMGIDFIDTDLYIITQRDEGLFLEKMKIESGVIDTHSSFVTRLDRRVSYDGADGVVTAVYAAGQTTFTLPYVLASDETQQAVTKATANDAGGELKTIVSTAGSTIVLDGDQTGATKHFWFGDKYTMTYSFSEPVIRENTPDGGRAVVAAGRYQLTHGTLIYADSGYFKVDVTPKNRSTYEYPFTGKILGTTSATIGEFNLDSGEFRFPIHTRSDSATINITNDSFLPSNLMSAEYEAQYNTRSRRFGG